MKIKLDENGVSGTIGNYICQTEDYLSDRRLPVKIDNAMSNWEYNVYVGVPQGCLSISSL